MAAILPNTKQVLGEVIAERWRQFQLINSAPEDRWDCADPTVEDDRKLAVLTEEVGEVAKAILESKPDELRTELIQVAAVAAAWAEAMTPPDAG